MDMDGLGGSLYEQLLATQKEEMKTLNLCTVKDALAAAECSDDETTAEEASAGTASALEIDGDSELLTKSAATSTAAGASDVGDAQPDDEEDLEALRLDAKAAFVGAVQDGSIDAAFERVKARMLQRRARNDIVEASRSGRLQEILKEGTPNSTAKPEGLPAGIETMQKLRQEAKERLLKAASEGRLQAALGRARHAAQGPAEDVPPQELAQPSENGSKTAAAAEEPEDEVEVAIAARTRRTLFRGARGAGLHTALRKEKGEALKAKARSAIFGGPAPRAPAPAPEPPKAAAEPAPVEAEAGTLRGEARDALVQALAEGRFPELVSSISQRKLKRDVGEILSKACKDSSLEAAVSEKAELKPTAAEDLEAVRLAVRSSVYRAAAQEEQEKLRQEAKATLLGAAKDGSLLACLGRKDEVAERESVRKEARAALLSATTDGSLSNILRQQKEDERGCQQKAKAALLAGASDGRLKAALQEMQEKKRAEQESEAARATAYDTLTGAACDGRLTAALEDVTRERLRQVARAALLGSARNGSLGECLKDVQASRIQAKEAAQQEGLRQEAKGTLLGAAKSGLLRGLLGRKQGIEPQQDEKTAGICNDVQFNEKTTPSAQASADEELEAARATAFDTLARAAVDGRLTAAVKDVAKERLRREAMATLLGGANNGSLRASLEDVRANRLQEKAEKAKQALFGGAASGQLRAALKEVTERRQPAAEEDAEQEHLRQEAKDTLLGAAKSGLLYTLLTQKPGSEPKQEENEAVVGNDLKFSEDCPTPDDVRRQARNVFADAARSGKLLGALEQESMESLRAQAKRSLLEAAVDGCLPSALQRLRTAGPSAELPAPSSPEPAQVAQQKATGPAVELPSRCASATRGSPQSVRFADSPKSSATKITFAEFMDGTPQAARTAGDRSPTSKVLQTPRPTSSSTPKKKADNLVAGLGLGGSTPPSREGGRRSAGSKPPSREGGRRSEAKLQPPSSPPAAEKPRTPTLMTSASDSALPTLGLATSTSRFSSRLRAASMAASAMALDLGAAAPESGRAPMPQFGLKACASTGSLRLAKSPSKRAPVFLPTLSKAAAAGGALAPALPAAAWATAAPGGSGREALFETAGWNLGGRSPAKWDISRAVF